MRDQLKRSVSSANQQLQTIWERFTSEPVFGEEQFNIYRVVAGAGIAISVIILQAFRGTGVSEQNALYSVICFAVAIPMQAAYLLLISTMKGPKYTRTPKSLMFILGVGIIFCGLGIVYAISHLSATAGLIFVVSTIVSALIMSYIYYSSKEYGIDD